MAKPLTPETRRVLEFVVNNPGSAAWYIAKGLGMENAVPRLNALLRRELVTVSTHTGAWNPTDEGFKLATPQVEP